MCFIEVELLGEICESGKEAGHGRGRDQKMVPCQGRFSLDLIQCWGS